MADATAVSNAANAPVVTQLHDDSTSLSSTYSYCFRFLDLAAEIRNRIYDFAVEATELDDPPQPGNGAYIGLTQVCRQIRKEFRKMYLRKVSFGIRNQDIERFAKAFFWLDRTSQPALIGQYPAHVHYLHTQSTATDILPLLNLIVAFPQTEFAVVPDPADVGQYLIEIICRFISKRFIRISPGLRHDLQESKISEFCHCDSRFYIWYKPGHTPYGIDMTLNQEGWAFRSQVHRMLGVDEAFEMYCDISFDGIDVRNSNNSSCRRAEDVE